MKKQVFYIHGGESFLNYEDFLIRLKTKDIWDLPSENIHKKWTEHLVENLGEGYEVFMPQMPNKWNARYEEWRIWFERHFEHLRDDLVLAGCSLGSMFLVKYLSENKLPVRVKSLYLMATAINLEGYIDDSSGDFMTTLEMISSIASKVEQIKILHSEDDFVVPYKHALKLKEILPEAELVTFEDKNHFLIPEFPELIEMLKRE